MNSFNLFFNKGLRRYLNYLMIYNLITASLTNANNYITLQ
ncbi:hypothetical protein FORC066_4372 [Yersinia enterocolitica]|nr:hypothetical protein FORC066_4372 [Yersinia enterocolitica]